MKRPLIFPAEENGDAELQKLIEFYNETLGFCPNSIKTMYHRPGIAHSFIALNKAVKENSDRVEKPWHLTTIGRSKLTIFVRH